MDGSAYGTIEEMGANGVREGGRHGRDIGTWLVSGSKR